MKCKVCGKEFTKSQFDPRLRLCSHECFTKDFWDEVLANPDVIIIDGTAYNVDPERRSSPYEFRGFGGRKFTIEKNDGTIINTTNLWCRGNIPDEYNAKDNAKFI